MQKLKTNTKLIRLLAGITACAIAVSSCGEPIYRPYKTQQANTAVPNKTSLINKAKSLLGTPYRYGGNTPRRGFDCSGFVQYTHAAVGIKLPRTTMAQYQSTYPVKRSNLKKGDLLFFRIDKKRTISHVGIYLGNKKFIHAPSSGKQVTIATLDNPYWVKHFTAARRVINQAL